jgi:hypothetical protein
VAHVGICRDECADIVVGWVLERRLPMRPPNKHDFESDVDYYDAWEQYREWQDAEYDRLREEYDPLDERDKERERDRQESD